MKRNNNILEENYMLISEWHSESTDNTGQNIQKFGSTVKFMVFMDQSEEALVDSLSDHFSSWDKFGIQFMQNVLKVVSLNRFF